MIIIILNIILLLSLMIIININGINIEAYMVLYYSNFERHYNFAGHYQIIITNSIPDISSNNIYNINIVSKNVYKINKYINRQIFRYYILFYIVLFIIYSILPLYASLVFPNMSFYLISSLLICFIIEIIILYYNKYKVLKLLNKELIKQIITHKL